ncbi:hypothetical protein CEXT_635731 [Caerostris extrusa]|uniref:Uncharacterized protein n=1 Tax=Caerostris extrusa TaxID=172846 RepID=A0AAV4RPQ0_CAEEX|nr:hypothetical protein CEXT_635731 [Caerostris extrusa]
MHIILDSSESAGGSKQIHQNSPKKNVGGGKKKEQKLNLLLAAMVQHLERYRTSFEKKEAQPAANLNDCEWQKGAESMRQIIMITKKKIKTKTKTNESFKKKR